MHSTQSHHIRTVPKEDIPLDDKDTVEYLTYAEGDISECDMNEYDSLIEFGSGFARQVIHAARPHSFADFVRVDGLIHGTDAWKENAELLIADGTAQLSRFNSFKRQQELERDWDEDQTQIKFYVSSEIILYSIEDIVRMSGWSETTVQRLFNDPRFPAIDYGKRKLVENHALMRFLSVRHEKSRNWR